MTIYRDGKAIELTGEEIAQVVKESHLDFYRDELRDSFYVPESKYDDIAEELTNSIAKETAKRNTNALKRPSTN